MKRQEVSLRFVIFFISPIMKLLFLSILRKTSVYLTVIAACFHFSPKAAQLATAQSIFSSRGASCLGLTRSHPATTRPLTSRVRTIEAVSKAPLPKILVEIAKSGDPRPLIRPSWRLQALFEKISVEQLFHLIDLLPSKDEREMLASYFIVAYIESLPASSPLFVNPFEASSDISAFLNAGDFSIPLTPSRQTESSEGFADPENRLAFRNGGFHILEILFERSLKASGGVHNDSLIKVREQMQFVKTLQFDFSGRRRNALRLSLGYYWISQIHESLVADTQEQTRFEALEVLNHLHLFVLQANHRQGFNSTDLNQILRYWRTRLPIEI